MLKGNELIGVIPTRADFDQALANPGELATGERICPQDRGAHAMHQPERGGMENEPHLIGGGAVARSDSTPAVPSWRWELTLIKCFTAFGTDGCYGSRRFALTAIC